MGRAAGVQEQGVSGVVRFQGREGIADAAEDDGQFVIEVVRGRSRDGARAVGFVRSLHIT